MDKIHLIRVLVNYRIITCILYFDKLLDHSCLIVLVKWFEYKANLLENVEEWILYSGRVSIYLPASKFKTANF